LQASRPEVMASHIIHARAMPLGEQLRVHHEFEVSALVCTTTYLQPQTQTQLHASVAAYRSNPLTSTSTPTPAPPFNDRKARITTLSSEQCRHGHLVAAHWLVGTDECLLKRTLCARTEKRRSDAERMRWRINPNSSRALMKIPPATIDHMQLVVMRCIASQRCPGVCAGRVSTNG
jgi:hypothetical protein